MNLKNNSQGDIGFFKKNLCLIGFLKKTIVKAPDIAAPRPGLVASAGASGSSGRGQKNDTEMLGLGFRLRG